MGSSINLNNLLKRNVTRWVQNLWINNLSFPILKTFEHFGFVITELSLSEVPYPEIPIPYIEQVDADADIDINEL